MHFFTEFTRSLGMGLTSADSKKARMFRTKSKVNLLCIKVMPVFYLSPRAPMYAYTMVSMAEHFRNFIEVPYHRSNNNILSIHYAV
jgi:hypothetical protein